MRTFILHGWLRRVGTTLSVIVFAFAGFVTTIHAKCGPQQPIHAVSANGLFSLRIDTNNRFDISRKGISVGSGEIVLNGHHNTGLIDDTGKFFVLHDNYEGISIYDAQGQRLRHFTPRDLLSVREQRTRPGDYACHPEGTWSREGKPVVFGDDGKSIHIFTHGGRRIAVDLQSARIVAADADIHQTVFVATAASVLLGAAFLWRIFKRKREPLAGSGGAPGVA